MPTDGPAKAGHCVLMRRQAGAGLLWRTMRATRRTPWPANASGARTKPLERAKPAPMRNRDGPRKMHLPASSSWFAEAALLQLAVARFLATLRLCVERRVHLLLLLEHRNVVDFLSLRVGTGRGYRSRLAVSGENVPLRDRHLSPLLAHTLQCVGVDPLD